MKIVGILLALLIAIVCAKAAFVSFGVNHGSDLAFTPLHTYFMAATGCSDANNGTSTATPWCSPNHAGVVCGDVIIANSGTYASSNLQISTSPGSCPSASGGIDGTGGIYFATVVCAISFACTVTAASGNAVDVEANNWSLQGWKASTTDKNAWCYSLDGGATGTTQRHHLAIINDICADAGVGMAVQDNGLNQNIPGNGGDYFAVIGSLTWNANQRSDFPTASIVSVGLTNFDSVAGTHIIFKGNYAIANAVTNSSTAYSDLEGLMIDTPGSHGYTGQHVVQDNIIYNSSWAGIQIFDQPINPANLTIHVANNTIYNNAQCTPPPDSTGAGTMGDLNLQLDGNGSMVLNIYNNISLSGRATVGCSGGGHVYAMLIGGDVAHATPNIGTAGTNIFKGLQSVCDNVCNAPNFDVVAFNGFGLGVNTYVDPAFSNTADLLANHLTQPNCSGFTDIASCMGWNFNTQTATNLSIISDLVATCGSCSGKGYRPPAPCAADSLYPTWLKGVVYLQANGFVNGATVTEKAGLVNKPCLM